MAASNVMGIFQFEDEFLDAAKSLKASGFDKLTLMSPVPLHAADEILGLGKSKVRYFTLFGALFGAVCGFALAVGTALVFILPTSGRPIITLPPYFVITYEVTILFGILFTLFGFHVVSGLPAWRDKLYKVESNIDRFTLVVELGEDSDGDKAEKIMNKSGAEEVNRVEGVA